MTKDINRSNAYIRVKNARDKALESLKVVNKINDIKSKKINEYEELLSALKNENENLIRSREVADYKLLKLENENRELKEALDIERKKNEKKRGFGAFFGSK